MRMRLFLIFVLGFFMLSLVSANFTVSDFRLQSDYSSGQRINAWVEISFQNQSTDAVFTDTFENSVPLSTILGLNQDYNYTSNSTSGTISSSSQRLYFSNSSFYTPTGSPIDTKYQINLTGKLVLQGDITVGNAMNSVDDALQAKKQELAEIKADIGTYDLFLRSRINSALKISEIEKEIQQAETLYNLSSSQEDYNSVLGKIADIKIPSSISETETANKVTLLSNQNKIDLEFIKSIGGGDYDISKESKYKEAISFWNQENAKPKVTFKKVNADYVTGQENLLSYIEISGQRTSDTYYLVVGNLNDLEFKENYGQISKQGYTYIDMSKLETSVIFTTTENVNFSDLPVFLSPQLDKVSVKDLNKDVYNSDEQSKISKMVWFILVSVFLIILFIVCYILLKTWYDKKYEAYLFKDRNQLYNLIVYINNAKRKGLKNNQIEENLRKARWSGEQIRYVMRKYAGKRTGMWSPFGDNEKKYPQSHKS